MFNLPSVSCILPTGYGHELVKIAIASYMTQAYVGRLELVIVDNNDTALLDAEEIENLPEDIVYVRSGRMSVGALRNIGTTHASGEICITWDEDDWSHPERVMSQVDRFIDTGKAVTGFHNLLYYDMATGGTYKYLNSPTGHKVPPYCIGTSQAYLKSWWEQHPFVDVGIEDAPFNEAALAKDQLDSVDGEQLLVARVHSKNVCPKTSALGQRHFPAVERSAFPQDFFKACSGA